MRLRAWPALLDLLAVTLMVFLLVSFLQRIFSLQDLQALVVRQQKAVFVELAEAEFKEEIDASQISILPDQSALHVTLSNQVLFSSGDYKLTSQGRKLIERWRKVFVEGTAAGFERVQVEGHTDSAPVQRTTYPSNNWQLSAARAISVVEILAAHSDLPGEKFSANAYSSFRPVAKNTSESGRSLNRRIEMRIFFDGSSSSNGVIGP